MAFHCITSQEVIDDPQTPNPAVVDVKTTCLDTEVTEMDLAGSCKR